VTPAAGATKSGRRSASVNGRGSSAVAASADTPSLGTSTKRMTPVRIAVSASLMVTHQYLSKPHCVSRPSSTPVPRARAASGASWREQPRGHQVSGRIDSLRLRPAHARDPQHQQHQIRAEHTDDCRHMHGEQQLAPRWLQVHASALPQPDIDPGIRTGFGRSDVLVAVTRSAMGPPPLLRAGTGRPHRFDPPALPDRLSALAALMPYLSFASLGRRFGYATSIEG
jgi:hypothetical protein